MSTPQDHIKRIQDKLLALVEKHNTLQKEHDKLNKSVQELTAEAGLLKEKNNQLSMQLNMLKIAESADSKDAKVALEKKINEYIKEIDKCIAMLGDQH